LLPGLRGQPGRVRGRRPHNARWMSLAPTRLLPARTRASVTALLLLAAAGCATRAVDVAPMPANPAEFMAWDCDRIDDERDVVQQRAADVAYSVDERAGNNIMALGVGITLFWPALLAMRPDGLEAADLARLKGRYEALVLAARTKSCPPADDRLTPARVATLAVALDERLVYEDRSGPHQPPQTTVLRVAALRRGEIELRRDGHGGGTWRQDPAGNMVAAPAGALLWPHLLRGDLVPGAVTAGDIIIVGDPLARARMRGQVVAVGPQSVAGRRFDAAVVELFGDAPRAEGYTRVDGSLVVDRRSGLLLRLDLRSAEGRFSVQRHLVRVDPPA